jgi:hypothetical protein
MSQRRAAAIVRLAVAVAGRPALWPTALRQLRRTAPSGWWRRRPFLPIPSGDYLRFRLLTQSGETAGPLAVDDVMDYLEWCREWERSLS